MSVAAAHNAIRQKFASSWGTRTPVKWDNVSFKPVASSWVSVIIDDSVGVHASFGSPGSNLDRYAGQLAVTINTPTDIGDAEALTYADEVTNIFRGWEDTLTGVSFREPPYVQQIGVVDNWFKVQVICTFIRDVYQ